MISRRHRLLLVVAVLGVGLASSTGGFSTAAVDRDISVQISDDDSAYVGFQQTPVPTGNATTGLEVTVTNRLPSGVELTTVEVAVDDTAVDFAAGENIGPWESASHTFTGVSCSDRVVVEASGDGVRLQFERPVACQ